MLVYVEIFNLYFLYSLSSQEEACKDKNVCSKTRAGNLLIGFQSESLVFL